MNGQEKEERLKRSESSGQWNASTLHDYFDSRLDDLEKHIESRFKLVDTRFLEMDKRFEQFSLERDRRYTEVNIEKEKALKIKETADLRALSLAREIQTYKDEKANELRSQIERERGSYATHSDLTAMGDKFEALINPICEFAAASRGRSVGSSSTVAWMIAGGGMAIAAASLFLHL